jgi:cytochrome c553
MKISWVVLGFASMASAMLIQSCESEGGDQVKISQYNGDESHNKGQNCMNCHKSGGEGEGWFNAAGTVYNAAFTASNPNTTVKLYTGPNGTGSLVKIIEVDGQGNFFTTEDIDFGQGLFPAVQGATTTKYMGTTAASGQCNSCHGVSTDKIWTE